MSQIEDPILRKKAISAKASIVSTPSTFASGCKIVGTSDEIINEIGEKFNLVYEKDECTRNGITYLQGALFAIGSKDLGNLEWREHSASSLRELFHQWKSDGKISSAFNSTFSDDVPNMKTDPNVYKRFENYYEYFSAICHHNIIGETHSLRQLYSPKTKGSSNNEEIFFKMVSDFLKELRAFFPK